jgi:hypothetical protein
VESTITGLFVPASYYEMAATANDNIFGSHQLLSYFLGARPSAEVKKK